MSKDVIDLLKEKGRAAYRANYDARNGEHGP